MMNFHKLTPLVLMLAGTALVAQESTGTVTGVVTTKAGAPVAGALVKVASPNLLGERQVTTDAEGRYRIPLLINGDYTITVAKDTFVTVKGTFRLLAGQTSKKDATLTPLAEVTKQAEAVVEVVSVMTAVDKTDTVTQTNYSMESLTQLFSPGINAISSISPGINGPITQQTNLHIRGGMGRGSKVLMNGLTITEEGGGYMYYNPTVDDLIESLALIQSPLNAKYGNTDGGITSITTTKGSNTFSGTMRAKYDRGLLGASNLPYPNRAGATTGSFNVPGDDISRTWDVTLRGPIWKDHITFAYGGTLTPTSYWTHTVGRLQSEVPQPEDTSGTFFRDPATGNVIRRTNLWSSGAKLPAQGKDTKNNFIVFAQLGANHQVEWNYSEIKSDWVVYDDYGSDVEFPKGNSYRNPFLGWNVSYKGIIGQGGVLEARFGRTSTSWFHPHSETDPIWQYYVPTLTPYADGSYAANSLPTGLDFGASRLAHNGYEFDTGDTTNGESRLLTYQHLLDWKGTHIIDIGYQGEKFRWDTQSPNARPTQFYSPGMIASDLTAADIYNPDPTAVKNPGMYAGKYIVFNYNAMLNQLDPTLGATALLNSPYESLIPSMRKAYGSENGSYWTETNSIYLNDLWTINDNHSVMAGLRVDMFKAKDTVRTIHSYSLPTLRFEYKWDIEGNQTKLVNVSAAQFHVRQPGAVFMPFAQIRLANATLKYWDKGTGTPYLVSKDEFMNPSNYGYTKSTTVAGSTFAIDPNWKAPVSNELTLGFRRGYDTGMNWRATLIYKTWQNIYDFFPGDVFDQNGQPALRRVMREDKDAVRTYKGVELEWFIPLAKRLNFGGSYTFNRLMSNDRNRADTPSRSAGQSLNWNAYIDQYVPRGTYSPNRIWDPEHFFKFYLNYDLNLGKVKSNLAVTGSYTSGSPTTRAITYQFPYPTVPGYYQTGTSYQNTSGLPNTVAASVDGYGITTQDYWNMNLKYNLEIPLVRSLAWFLSVEAINFLNHRMLGGYSLPGNSSTRQVVGQPNPYPYGWRGSGSFLNLYNNHPGLRSFNVQTGLRF